MKAQKPWVENMLRALGPEVFRTDPDSLAAVSRDESELGPFEPEAVVLAQNAQQVVKALEIAGQARVPVYPRGTGTGLTGGALAVRAGLVVDTSRMNRILEIDPENLIAVVEPGVITGELRQACWQQGVFYPPDPASLDSCTIGGNLAENAGGPMALKYGLTVHHTLLVEMALSTGQLVTLGKMTKKGVTGYEMACAVVGSEGTLGVFTKAVLRLVPRPETAITGLALFSDEQSAVEAVGKMVRKGILPAAMEFVDARGMQVIRENIDFGIPKNATGMLVLETHGTEDTAWQDMERAAEIAQDTGAFEVSVARHERDRQQLWQARRSLSTVMRERFPGCVDDDVCVPRSAIPQAVQRARRAAEQLGAGLVIFGHAGDGNLHFKIVPGPQGPKPVREAIYRIALELGGSISGEHGIGLLKKDYISWELSRENLRLQTGLKTLFDPKGIMNPGKFI